MHQTSIAIRKAATLSLCILAADCAHERASFPHTGYAAIDDDHKRCVIRDDFKSGTTAEEMTRIVEWDYNRCLFVPVIISAAKGDGEDGEVLGLGRTQARDDLVADIHQIFTARNGNGAKPRFLLLSGGGEHGAFGAGLLLGMARANQGKLPAYDIVTGVSTGSIQSTFVFLANTPLSDGERDKKYPAYMKARPEIGSPGKTYLEDLALAYAIDKESELLHVRPMGTVSLIAKGSFANMNPLRSMMKRLITTDTLRQVAREYKINDQESPKRLLLVGVTNEDDSFGYAINLTKIAYDAISQYDKDHDDKRLLAAREVCI